MSAKIPPRIFVDMQSGSFCFSCCFREAEGKRRSTCAWWIKKEQSKTVRWNDK